LINILKDSSAKTNDATMHVPTSKSPPWANAHGSANPPAPKIALTVFTMAAFSPDSSAADARVVVDQPLLRRRGVVDDDDTAHPSIAESDALRPPRRTLRVRLVVAAVTPLAVIVTGIAFADDVNKPRRTARVRPLVSTFFFVGARARETGAVFVGARTAARVIFSVAAQPFVSSASGSE
jgi:hypothetical protein